jgi:hypothetical protein
VASSLCSTAGIGVRVSLKRIINMSVNLLLYYYVCPVIVAFVLFFFLCVLSVYYFSTLFCRLFAKQSPGRCVCVFFFFLSCGRFVPRESFRIKKKFEFHNNKKTKQETDAPLSKPSITLARLLLYHLADGNEFSTYAIDAIVQKSHSTVIVRFA